MGPRHNVKNGLPVHIQEEIPRNSKMNMSGFQRTKQGKSLLSTVKRGKYSKNLENKIGNCKCHHFSEKLLRNQSVGLSTTLVGLSTTLEDSVNSRHPTIWHVYSRLTIITLKFKLTVVSS